MMAVTHAFTLAEAAEQAGGTLRLPAGAGLDAAERGIDNVTIDSRALGPGALFVPLPGSRVDGHEFLAPAFGRGAAAALCARGRAESLHGRLPGPLIVVEDVTRALQRLSQRHRAAWDGLLLGVTGSAGKTTTKDLVAAALAADRPTLKTEGNLNNHWGVPLTLVRLRPEHRAAVVEMGMNQPGEIAFLSTLARPDAAVITNVGHAHLEAFGTVAAIAIEKTALARALPAGAPVFAGVDSEPLSEALRGATQRVIGYGFSERAAVRPSRIEDLGARGLVLHVAGFPPCRVNLVGRHQALNALAALAVAREYRLDPEAVVRALEAHAPAKGRMEVRRASGGTLLVDCYNANPESTRAALETLAGWPDASRRIAILGDMLELGPAAPELHEQTGAAVHSAELWTLGAHAADYARGARAAGAAVRVFEDAPRAAAALREAMAPGVVVLIKASRGAALERVLDGVDVGPGGA